MDKRDLPLGFGMALAENEAAMQKFESLTEVQKVAVINKTRKINSRQDMESFVSCLSVDGLNI